MNYATFWQRFSAMWIDIFVFVPIGVVQLFIEGHSKLVAMVLIVPMTALGLGYHIYCHGRFGKTLGKHAMGIRVVRLDGTPIGWPEAWKRSSVDVVFALANVVAMFIALSTISDASYYDVPLADRARNIQAMQPEWAVAVQIAINIWVWSEVVVMLFNERRRALHDFIAGTIVVSDRVSIPVESKPA